LSYRIFDFQGSIDELGGPGRVSLIAQREWDQLPEASRRWLVKAAAAVREGQLKRQDGGVSQARAEDRETRPAEV